jgi:hypothetical protein
MRPRNIVRGEFPLRQATGQGRGTPRPDVRRSKVSAKTRVVGPEFGEPDQSFVEGIFSHIVGNAAIVFVGRLDQRSQVWQQLRNAFRRKSQGTENGYGGLHVDSSLVIAALIVA